VFNRKNVCVFFSLTHAKETNAHRRERKKHSHKVLKKSKALVL
jgi:hypothetical protein